MQQSLNFYRSARTPRRNFYACPPVQPSRNNFFFFIIFFLLFFSSAKKCFPSPNTFLLFLHLHKKIFSFSKCCPQFLSPLSCTPQKIFPFSNYFPPFSSPPQRNIFLLQIFSSFSFSIFLHTSKIFSFTKYVSPFLHFSNSYGPFRLKPKF